MAEPLKDKKPSLRQLLEDLAEDMSDDYTDEERQLAKDKILELDCQKFVKELKNK